MDFETAIHKFKIWYVEPIKKLKELFQITKTNDSAVVLKELEGIPI